MPAHYAATYSAYLERKKKEGKKPLSRAEWEARTQGGTAAGSHPKGNKPTKTWKKKYSPKVETVMDNHALTDDDADQVREFKSDKPSSGIPATPAQLMQRFLAKAKPETRERMKGVSPAEFMQMLGAIMEDEEGAGKTASLRSRLIRLAAAKPELRQHILPLVSERVAAEQYSVREATRIYDAFAKGIGRAVGSVSDVTVRGDILVQRPREFTGISVVGDDPKDPQYAVWLHIAPDGLGGVVYRVEIRAFQWPGGRGRIRAWENATKAYDEAHLMEKTLPYITHQLVADLTR
jgi:hypothetical protein